VKLAPLARLLGIAALAGCGPTQVEPSKPQFLFTSGGSQLDETRPIWVGAPIDVAGKLSAMCERSATKLGDKNDSTEYFECNETTPALQVTCEGPCTVNGTRVTPTSPGTITIQVHMSGDGKRYARAINVPVVPHGTPR
jgi:hypothetical protein